MTPPAYRRHRLPDDRHAVIHKFSVGEHEGYLTVGEYAGGEPGELFIHISKEGSTVSGLMDAVGALTSVALQSGVPVETLVRKFSHSRFEPSGWTRNPQMGYASSILDYVFRWMGMRYLDTERSDVAAGQAPLPLQPADPARPAERRRRALRRRRRRARLPQHPAHGVRHPAAPRRGVSEPARRTAVHRMWARDGAQRQLLPLLQLRCDVGMQLGVGQQQAVPPAHARRTT